MTEDEATYYEDVHWIDDEERLATRAKQRRIRLLEDQLDDVKEDLKERVQIHKNLEKKFQREKDFKERKLDRLRKFGSPKTKEKKEGELKEEIESLNKERWREQIRVWRDSQDLFRKARKMNRSLVDRKRRVMYKELCLVLKDMPEKRKGKRS